MFGSQNLRRKTASISLALAAAGACSAAELSLRATMISQGGTVGAERGAGKGIALSFSADIEIEQVLGQADARIFAHAEAGTGNGIEPVLPAYSGANADINDEPNLQISELFYEQWFWDERVSVTVGLLDPTVFFDGNAFANDETAQFLAPLFRNSPVIEFPGNTAGLHVGAAISEWFLVALAGFSGDGDRAQLGTDALGIGQLTVRSSLLGQEGNYRALAWYSSAEHRHWDDSRGTKPQGCYGAALSIDQEILGAIGIFGRYGWQRSDVHLWGNTAHDTASFALAQAWSAGVHLVGSAWHREGDEIGLVVGQVVASRHCRTAGIEGGEIAPNEFHGEFYYRLQLNDHVGISPDVQVLVNPLGNSRVTGFVYGVRAQVGF